MGERFEMKIKHCSDEKGFASAILVFLVIILCALSLAASILIQSEGFVIGNNIDTRQADYALQGVASFAMEKIRIAGLDELNPFSVGGIDVYMDTSQTTDYNANVLLTVSAQGENFDNTIYVYLKMVDGPLSDYAIYVSGYVSNVRVQDDDDDTLMVQEAMIPAISTNALYDTATAQGRVISGPFMPADDYPNKDFWENPTTPCVTYVEGDLDVVSPNTIYGIYVVEGDVFIDNGATVEGVIYMANEGSEVSMGYSAKSNGGFVGYCNIIGSSIFGLMSKVRYRPEYMAAFDSYRIGMMKAIIKKDTWIYQ